jgi:uncharacterized protein (DUF302 family)
VSVFSGWRHARLVRELDRGEVQHSRPSTEAVAIAFLLALIGLAMAIYLVSVRDSTHSGIEIAIGASMTSTADNGIVDTPTNHSVDEVVERVKGLLRDKGITLFALVDHSGEAEKTGMRMRPTKLLLFGIPRSGAPVMLAAPSIAIDFPLKILVWEDGQGKVWLSYNSPEYLKKRHGVPDDLVRNIAAVGMLVQEVAK